ncbi:hypothetical protein B0H13DRAFT_1925181 [Mycena leptocephala]|nr:hypothetical protein B0H13DRAFT_1925181 [Mycena leptocephala]
MVQIVHKDYQITPQKMCPGSVTRGSKAACTTTACMGHRVGQQQEAHAIRHGATLAHALSVCDLPYAPSRISGRQVGCTGSTLMNIVEGGMRDELACAAGTEVQWRRGVRASTLAATWGNRKCTQLGSKSGSYRD